LEGCGDLKGSRDQEKGEEVPRYLVASDADGADDKGKAVCKFSLAFGKDLC